MVLNQLYRYTQLQDTVGVNLLALDGGVPKVMSLKTMLERYVQFQDQVIRRRTQFDLNKARERAHILEGLARAVDIVDDVIYTIRHCGGGQAEAKAAIMAKFGFDDPQADAICKFPLGRLAGLEILKIENELDELHKKIADWTAILADDAKVLAIVTEELLALKEKYGDERRTEIAHVSGEVDIEDLIPVEECVFTLTHAGYIKRQSKDTYQVQKRGGRGISGLSHKDEDFVEELFIGSTHDYVLFVTDQGRVYRLKGYQIYEGSRTSKGTNIVNLLPLQNEESVIRMLCMPADKAEGFLTIVTKRGLIKRTPIEAYSNIRKSGLLAVGLYEGDSLAWCRITSGSDELLVATRDGMAIRFDERGARQMGRMGHGVRAVRLAEGDEVVGVGILRPGATVFTVTENGKGRRSRVDDYRIQSRGGKASATTPGGALPASRSWTRRTTSSSSARRASSSACTRRTSTSRAATAAACGSCAWPRATVWSRWPAPNAATRPRWKSPRTSRRRPSPTRSWPPWPPRTRRRTKSRRRRRRRGIKH